MSLLKVCLLVLLALLLVALPLAAQEVPFGCIVAQKGDGFWRISEREAKSPLFWAKLRELNPKMVDGRDRKMTRRGEWYYVDTIPGEKICGLDKLGLVPKLVSAEEAGFIQNTTTIVEKVPNWLWWLLAFFVALVIFAAFRQWLMRRDPTRVGAGRVVENGINTPSEAAQHFRAQAAQELGDTAGVLPDMVRIISMIRGRGFGPVHVMDRVRALFHRILNGEVVWQATVQAPNRTPQIRYTLAGCGNDLRWGGGMAPEPEFRFVADRDVTDEIQREPVYPAQPEPAPAPQTVSQPVPVPAQPESEPAPQPITQPEPPAREQPAPVQPEPAPTQEPPTPVTTPSGEFVRTMDAPSTSQKPVFEMKVSKDGKPCLIAFDSEYVEECTIGRDRRIIFRYNDPKNG